MSYTVENITLMTGGTSIPIGDHTWSPSNFKYKEELPWYTGTAYSFDSETTGATTNLYYKINGRSGNSFIVSTGVYVDIPIELPWQVVSGMDFVPQYMWYVLSSSSLVSITDANDSSQTHSTSFSSSGATEVGIPGTLLSYEVSELPYDDYYSDYGTRYGCTATYRFWLCSNFDFLLSSAAKLSITQKIDSSYYYTENVYLHFDNVPYITCPSEIIDEDYGFNVEYSFPNLSKIEYIQFALCDEMDNLIIDYRDIPKTSNNYAFDLSYETELAKLYAKYNTVNEATIYLSVRYKSSTDDAPIYITYPMNFVIVTEKPTVSVSLSDPKGLVAADEVFIEGMSDLYVVINPVAYKGASITYTAIGNGGKAFYNVTEATFEAITDKWVEVLCKDSRGNSVSQQIVMDGWIPYIAPSCSISAEAPNTDGYLPITLSGIYFDSYDSWTNGFNIYYKYASSNSENSVLDWTLVQPRPTIEPDSSYRYTTTFELLVPNHADTYTVQLQFSDKFNTYTTNSVTVKSTPVFDWGQEDFNFNVPVTIQGDLTVTGSINGLNALNDDSTADYVVEQGTVTTGSDNSTANWVYRKWNSGIAECWCRKHISTAVNTAWGNLYVSGALSHTNITWGVDFIDIPVANITIAPNASGAFLIAGGSTSLTATNTGGYEIARGSALSSAGNFYINYYGIGKWK